LGFSVISQSLNRDRRTIWNLYNRAIQKIETKFYKFEESDISIPLSAFCDRNLSFTEAIIVYLREKGYKNKEIAEHLKKDQRSVGLLFSRAKKKRGDIK
jgi:DNA-binding NarL/FixJ family response regulator